MDLSVTQTGLQFHKHGKVALIDADIVARACASAADGRRYNIGEDLNGKRVVYQIEKYKKDAVEFCNENDLPLSCIKEEYIPDPLENCLHSAKIMYQGIIKAVKASSAIGFLTPSTGNFREQIATSYPYKGTRWSKKKRDQMRSKGKWIDWLDATEASFKESRTPAHLRDTKNYLFKYFGCRLCDGQEADDAMGIAQYQDFKKAKSYVINKADNLLVKNAWTNTIICSIDKDLDMIPGWHYRWSIHGSDPRTYYVTEEVAIRAFYEQLLKGDTTDTIIGLRGIGPAKAKKALEDCTTEEEMFNVVLCMYDGDYDRVLENGRLLWIRREENELWLPNI